MKNKKFVVAGVGFNDILTLINNNNNLKKYFVGFIDDKIKKKKNCLILGKWNILRKNKKYLVFNSVGKNMTLRNKATKKLLKYKVNFINLISNKASLGNCKLGKGIAIFDYTFLGDNVEIGDQTIIHNNVSIGHDTKIGKNCFIAPGVKILGKCKIGNNVFLGANCVVVNNIEIKKNVSVGSNTTVFKNTKPNIRLFQKYDNVMLKNLN